VAGVKYVIKMEYYENSGGAVAKLLWSSASTAKAIIPQKQLYLPNTGARVADVQALDIAVTERVVAETTGSLLKTGVYPNPVISGQNAILQINSDRGGIANLQVVSTTGNIVQNEQLNVAPGANTKTMRTGNLRPGIYIIRVTGNVDKATTLKLVVQ
jgi:hypothetical protein